MSRQRTALNTVGIVILTTILASPMLMGTVTGQDEGPLQLWMPDTVVDEDNLREQLEEFSASTLIFVELTVIPSSGYYNTLLTAVMSGEAPDVAITTYSQTAPLVGSDSLASIDDYTSEVDLDDFLPDALSSTTFSGLLYGLPLWGASCTTDFRNLVLFSTGSNPQNVVTLMDFLTRLHPDQIAQTYETFVWYPTRHSVYSELELEECPPTYVYRPSTAEVALVPSVADVLATSVEDLLEGAELSPGGTAIFDPDNPEPTEDSPTLIATVPVTTAFTEEDLAEFGPEGVILGALRIGSDSIVGQELSRSGDFVQKCYGDFVDTVSCELIPVEGETIFLTSDPIISLPAPISWTAIYFKADWQWCFDLDGKRICITIG